MWIFMCAISYVVGCSYAGDMHMEMETSTGLMPLTEEHMRMVTIQDESIAAAASSRQHDVICTKNILMLSDGTYSKVKDAPVTLVLFYYPFEAKSQLTLRMYAKAANTLKSENVPGSLSAVNCDDSTYLCQRQNIRSFPTILVYHGNSLAPERYAGVISTSALVQAAKKYLEAGSMDDTSEMDTEQFVELEVGQFPHLLSLGKPFVIAFTTSVNSELVPILESVASSMMTSRTAIFTWMDTSKSDRTAMNILEHHVTSPKSEELLVIDTRRGTVHQFTEASVDSETVKKWVSGVLEGEIPATKMLSKNAWKPRLPAYDFLGLMDYAASKKPKETEFDLRLRRLEEDGISKDDDLYTKFDLPDNFQKQEAILGIPGHRSLPEPHTEL